MDIAEWLRGLGLDQYASAFRDNDIDAEVLRRLTAEDLRELGVASVGHRRRLLDAIAALSDGPPAAEATPADAASAATAEAERRQLTIMFCDLVGSTELAIRLDPEDLHDIIAAYHRRVTEVVTRYGGFVARLMGDGVLAYFGYPLAHEDDAERAVRSGLAIVEAISALGLGQPLEVRIGIATGLVVVGDLIGTGAAHEEMVTGETPNLAARLQSLAAPNAVIVSHSTRCQLGMLFEMQDLGPQVLKGFAAGRELGASSARAVSKAGLRPCAPPRHHWSTARRNLTCCCGGGPKLRAAMAGSCCFQPKRASANRGWPKRWSSASPPRSLACCAISVLRITRIAPYSRSSPSSNAPLGSCATTRRRHSWKSLPRCSATALRQATTWR